MPRYEADDDIHRARYVYLGPPGYTLPLQLTYAQWGVFFGFGFAFVLVSWLLTGDLAWFGVAVAAAMVATYAVFRVVNPDRPARAVLLAAVTDWRTTRRDDATDPQVTTASITIGAPE